MGLLGELLQDAGIAYSQIGQIAVTRGPGSFTGIRVGLATARGLALGLKVPVVGVSVLAAIALEHKPDITTGQTPLVTAMDAKRGEVFMQIYSTDGAAVSAPFAASLDQLSNHLPDTSFQLAGSASTLIVDAVDNDAIEVVSNQVAASIGTVAQLAVTLPREKNPPEPLYLRSADAKPQNNYAVQTLASPKQQKMNL